MITTGDNTNVLAELELSLCHVGLLTLNKNTVTCCIKRALKTCDVKVKVIVRGGLHGRLAAWLKLGGPVRPWAGLTRMTISKTCNVFFIKSQ